MWRYNDKDFDPAAPAVLARVSVGSSSVSSVLMQLDCGADITCVPKGVMAPSFGLRYNWVTVADYGGTKRRKKVYYVDLRFCEETFDNVEVVVVEGHIGLVGRDILNMMKLTLNGPEERFLFKC